MKGLSGMLASAYATWLSPFTSCCAQSSTHQDKRPLQNGLDIYEKMPPTITYTQPAPMPSPFAGPVQKSPGHRPRLQEKPKGTIKRSFASLRERFSVRKRSRSGLPQRRLQISAPTNFRHLHSESFQFPQYTNLRHVGRTPPPRPLPRPRPSSFRPLELSIYVSKGELSPILPHFDMVTPPPPARLQPNPEDDVFGPSHELKYSPMSFHLPRKPSASPSPTTATTASDTPPRIPPKSRARSHTSCSTDAMKERIACAMLEVDRLQHEIDLVMRRQSYYTNSRPSTSHSIALMVHEGSLPTVPALPPAAPSFAERLNPGVERPHTAPPRPPSHIPHRGMVFAGDDTAAFITPPPSRGRETRPLPPPLPLVLRPPLRKKKSFSRVSSWLFPGGAAGQHHQRSISRDSITNFPRPVKDREGFYQCVQVPQERRTSIGSMSTVSTSESEDGGQTVPTAWSPSSTLATRTDELPMDRPVTFGKEKNTGGTGGSGGTNFAGAF